MTTMTFAYAFAALTYFTAGMMLGVMIERRRAPRRAALERLGLKR